MNIPPFTEAEKRFILAEAIKTSNIPNERILNFLKNEGGKPVFGDMLLPGGRTVNHVVEAWLSITANPAPSSSAIPSSIPSSSNNIPGFQPIQTSAAAFESPSSKKRKLENLTPTARALQPRPATNGTPTSTHISASGLPYSGKKRGRPSKADLAAREAAIARGELPPPREKTARRSLGSAGSGSAGIGGNGGGVGIAPMLPSGWNSPIGVGQGGMIGRGDLGRGEGGLPHGLGGAGSMRIGGLLNAEEGPGERMEVEREKKRSRHSGIERYDELVAPDSSIDPAEMNADNDEILEVVEGNKEEFSVVTPGTDDGDKGDRFDNGLGFPRSSTGACQPPLQQPPLQQPPLQQRYGNQSISAGGAGQEMEDELAGS